MLFGAAPKASVDKPEPSKTQFLPWIEKYRPKNISEISSQSDVVATLRKSLESQNIPHLLFYGPPGTGKTSTILAIARELYGPKMIKERVLELNASDERGIDVVRHKVKSFAQIAVGRKKDENYPCPPYKIIILDEADAMTRDAQSALRRTMERYSKVTRFCLICNYISRIIAPVASRCAKFRFKSLDSESQISKLREIAGKERLEVDEEAYKTLVKVSGGDMRKAITLLQSSAQMRVVGSNDPLMAKNVESVVVQVPQDAMDFILKQCRSKVFTNVQTAANAAIKWGYPCSQIVDHLTTYLVNTDELDDSRKAQMAIVLAEADRALCDGADESLQLLNVLCELTQLYGA